MAVFLLTKSIPHTCGGEPGSNYLHDLIKKYSPHVWG